MKNKSMRLSDLPADLINQMEGHSILTADFDSDGCTGILDIFIAIDLRPACFVHDARYAAGTCQRARAEADRELFRNLIRLNLNKFMAYVIFFGVRIFGARHFNFSKDPGIAAKCLRMVSGRQKRRHLLAQASLGGENSKVLA